MMSLAHGYNTVVHDLPRFLVNYAHAQTVETRPTFERGGWGLGMRLWVGLQLTVYVSCLKTACKPAAAVAFFSRQYIEPLLLLTRNTQAKYASRSFICIICAGWVLVNCGLYLSLMHAGLKYRCSLRCGES